MGMNQSMKNNRIAILCLCCICIAVNLVGVQIATRLQLPLYLDCVGIILASALGGSIPGIIVGFFSNIINGISDHITIYYSMTSVMIAISSAWFAKKDCFRRFPNVLSAILGLSLIGGGIGSVLTWCLFGGGIGDGFTSTLAHSIFDSGLLNEFFSRLSADFLYDILDKSIEVLLVIVILRLLPKSITGLFPSLLNDERHNTITSVKHLSLRHKVLGALAIAAITVTVVVTWISLRLYHNSVIEEESNMAFGVCHAGAAAFDADRIQEYIDLGEKAPGYLESEERLASIANSSENIAYIYVYKILEDGCHVVFDPDTDEGAGSEPGEIIPFDQAFMDKVPDLLAGRQIDPIVSNESYGWLLSVYLPVTDSSGICQCYVGVDILMRELAAKENIFLTKVASLFFSFFIMILAIAAWLADHAIIHPINDMAAATIAFASNLDGKRENTLKRIRGLNVQTGDEIENLYHAIQSNAEETVEYIAAVNAKNEQIAQLQNGLIMVLADLVESRDQCTGNHIRNTATYAKLIVDKMKEDGIEINTLTYDYVLDVIRSAPLHDVGKIQIPDAILNKPGRLTEEEFKLMKTHTTIGGEIIDRATSMMPPESAAYMTEAKNITMYHHERWDGKGYPLGLKGEEIPLSARIMAVADVFDALVARRSYKEGFPFDKAIQIIQEESGTHFDPQVVNAFLKCKDEVRKITEQNTGKR